MKKKVILFILAVFMFALVGCGGQNEKENIVNDENSNKTSEIETIKITTPNAPNSIPLFYMKENNLMGDNVQLNIMIHKSGEEAVAKTIKNEIDMANFGVQEAAKLYNEGVKIRLMDISTWATFEMLTVRDDIQNWQDLKGKNLWIGDKGGPMDYLTQIVANENNINLESDLHVNRASASELSQMVVSDIKDIDVFVLREPFISKVNMKNKAIKTAFDLGEEYESIFKLKIPQGGTIVTEKCLTEKKELVSEFQKKYQEAIQWTMEHPTDAGKLGAKYMEGSSPEIWESAVKNMDMEFISIENSADILNTYFNKAMGINNTMLEGKVPSAEFYKKLF